MSVSLTPSIDLYSKILDYVGLEAAGITILRTMVTYKTDKSLIKETNEGISNSLQNTRLLSEYKEYIKQFLDKNYQT